MRIVCMIPARLGSKRIKDKNLRLLDGKPLVAHVVEKAKEAGIFDEIYINSEAKIFENIANEYNVKFYHRAIELASDDSTNDDFVKDFISHIECDILVQINPTSPLITVDDVKNFVSYMGTGFSTLHSVKEERIEAIFTHPLNFNPDNKMPRSQDLKPIYLFCSAMMAWKTSTYVNTYGTSQGNVAYFVLKGFSTIDIDNEEDFQLAELAIQYQKDAIEPKYYEYDPKLRTETDVPTILEKDGVTEGDFSEENLCIINLKDVCRRMPDWTSWAKRVINTENNSATLISQFPGQGNRLHYHKDWNEWWYIVEGQWKFVIEQSVHYVKEGDLVFIPKGKWHRIEAVGDKPAVRLAVSKDKVGHIYEKES